MIDKNVNIIKDPKIKRIVEYSNDNKQVNVLDQRFYRRDGKYYPSVSSILNYFPKNQFFHSWLKDVGHNSDIIAQKAAGEGTQVHNAVEAFLNGEEINWIDEYGNAKYNLDVWRMILKFADFWNTHKPELIATEYHLFSDEYEYAGTADLIVRINGELWLLDIIDMVKYNLFSRGYKYISLAVDVFSRKVFAVPLKSKDIPHVLEGLKELTKHEKPRCVLSDHEPAFIGNEFYEYLKKQEIILNVNKLGDQCALGILDNFVKKELK